MNILRLLIMTVAAVLVLWRAPFPLPLKVLMLFSGAFVYFFPVASRSYCLIPPIVCMIAVCCPGRHEHPLRYGLLIALLVQTHLIMLGMAGALCLFWLGEALANHRRKPDRRVLFSQARGLCLPLFSLILLLLLLHVSDSSAFHVKASSPLQFIFSLVRYCCGILFQVLMSLRLLALGILGLCLLYLFLSAASRRGGAFVKALCIALWLFWVVWPSVRVRRISFVAAVCAAGTLFLCAYPFYAASFDALTGETPYSDSTSCAACIRENLPVDEPVLAAFEPTATALLPYLDRDGFYSVSSGERFSFTTWINRETRIRTYADLRVWAAEVLPGHDSVYLLISWEDGAYQRDCIEGLAPCLTEENLLYRTNTAPVKSKEQYELYRIPL